MPMNSNVVISGKINYYKKNYQITNPAYIVPIEKEEYVNTIIPKYELTEGLTEKIYRKLIDQVLTKVTLLKEWHSQNILKEINKLNAI